MKIPCHRGGHHCSWPACPLDCDGRKQTKWIAPDYSKPGTREAVNKSVDEAYNDHWPIDKTRQ